MPDCLGGIHDEVDGIGGGKPVFCGSFFEMAADGFAAATEVFGKFVAGFVGRRCRAAIIGRD